MPAALAKRRSPACRNSDGGGFSRFGMFSPPAGRADVREQMASEEGRVCRAAALEHCGPCRRAVRDFCLRSFEDVSEENRMRRAGSGPPGHHAEKTRFGGGSMPAGCVCFTFEEP